MLIVCTFDWMANRVDRGDCFSIGELLLRFYNKWYNNRIYWLLILQIVWN